jgi:hypothetical protein
MLADVEQFLQRYRSALNNGATGYSSGGYPRGKIVSVNERGQEFIMSASTTRLAEQMLGGRLNQERLIRALSNPGGASVTWNDHRRFDSKLSAEDRRAIRRDGEQMLAEVFLGT